jgi:LmbE family N-acetylglucosaminyl deacetylase
MNLRPIFLSPHPDDAVLSCGGLIYQLAQDDQRPIVITLFGGDRASAAPLSDFARSLHQRWQLNEAAPAARRDEDRAACDRLGAYLIHLPFADAIYRIDPITRQPLYASEEAIFGDVRDRPIIDPIAQALQARLDRTGAHAQLFVPLTAGHHVDHQIVRAAAERLNVALTYYEDYPYAEDTARLAPVWGTDEWQSEPIAIGEAALRAKIEAFLCHRSQITTFYSSDDEVARRIRAYAESLGHDRPIERYWRKV